MNDRVFLDSNVVIYAHEAGPDPRCLAARRVMQKVTAEASGWISAQVIAEFISTITRKPPVRLAPAEAVAAASRLAGSMTLVPLDEAVVREALRAVERYGLDYFDAQIWAVARVSGCRMILTEDTHGEEIEGVAYVNPFLPGLDVDEVLDRRRD